jgi:hypothetical protein
MAQEEKRVIIHFDTLEGFQARLTDGTLTEKGDYIVLIKDSALIWVKGQFFTGPSVLSIPKYIKDCEIIQENGKPLTLKFVGAEWNTEEKIYKEFNKTIELSTNSNSEDSSTINAATTSQAGVMSAADKQKLDTINQAKTLSSATAGQWIRFAELSDSGYNSALVTIKEGTAGATFFFKCRSNGEVTVKVMDVTPNIYLTKIRVIKQNGQSNGYLEAYVDTASSSIAANISLSININLTDITVTSEIPGGYTSEEVSLV